MKKVIYEDENEGMTKLLGEKVTLICCRFFYTGKLIGVNDVDVLLDDAAIVYDTGAWDKKEYADIQKLPGQLYVSKASIESYGVLK
jgi:hypothetical protein